VFPSPLKVLVIDDDEDARELLGELLETRGCVISAHGTARAAIDAVHTFAPHVAIVDLHLPDIDGLELIRILRSAAVSPLRVVVLTGLLTRDTQQRAAEAGADAFLGKPARSDALLEAIGLPRKS
jgi:CheY-like chemotaxis protein